MDSIILSHLIATSIASPDPKTLNDWSLKIIEIYMSWYTFFLSSNIIVLGWIFGTKIDESVKPMLTPIGILFCILNLLATSSTVLVGYTTISSAPNQAFRELIRWAAIANATATIGFFAVWGICIRRLNKSSPALSASSSPEKVANRNTVAD